MKPQGEDHLDALLERIRSCRHCADQLLSGPRPVVQAGDSARILIVGQAPGSKVHESGTPWMDASGTLLRQWLGIDETIFYDSAQVAVMPMGFCYPGKGNSGDLPPRPECAPLWHETLLGQLPRLRMILLIGRYSQNYYLGKSRSLTENVRAYREFLPRYFPLPHPSPRNRHWFKQNSWFATDVIPELRRRVKEALT